ncbi:MAG: hypothetical protein J7K73_03190 [Nanoarchaeota archaeon]|nr:hypothetical protein [Nanoarchaeota archaeon]
MRNKLLTLGILAIAIALSTANAQIYYKCYDSCPAKNQTVGCEVYVNGNLAIQVGNQTNFYYYEYINDTTNNNLEELVCYYLGSNITILSPAKAMKSPKTPPVIPPLPVNPKPGNPPLKNPPMNPPLFNLSNPITPEEEVKLGQNIFNAKYFTCTKDCPAPQSGYQFIGCMIVVNHAVFNAVGRFPEIKVGQRIGGYTYITSHTDVKDGNIVYEEILSCQYWKRGEPLPPKWEPFDYREYYWESRGYNLSEYDKQANAKVQANFIHEYNNQITNLPGIAKNMLGNENLHIFFEFGNETIEYAAKTRDGMIVETGNWIDGDNDGNYDLWQEKGERTTMKVYFDQAAIEKIAESDNPVKAFKEAWGNEIKYEGVTATSKIKTFFMDVGVFFAGLFS